MRNRLHTGHILACALLMLFTLWAGAQSLKQAPSRQIALDQFSKGNYAAAFEQFNSLYSVYPRDPLYKYYCGVCLVKMGKDPENALELLKEARLSSAGLRTIPDDVVFYLGRALQQTGNFGEAINSYKEFTGLAGRKNAKDYQTPKFIQECNDRKGAISVSLNAEKVASSRDTLKLANKEAEIIRPVTIMDRSADTTDRKEQPSVEYVNLLNEALKYQYIADSLTRLSLSLRDQLSSTSVENRPALKARIADTDKSSLQNQKKADEMILVAKKISGQQSGQELSSVNSERKDTLIKKVPETVVGQRSSAAVRDTSTKVKTSSFKEIIAENKAGNNLADTLRKTDKVKPNPPPQIEAGVFYLFGINSKQSSGSDDKVPVNTEVEPGLVYRIQLAVFRNQVFQSYFKGIFPVYGFRNEGSDATIYYAGLFRRYSDASGALVKVRSAGFKDSFIVALMDKKIVSQERATALEKVWGERPFNMTGNTKKTETIRDTVPPTLVFRVEAAQIKKPLADGQVENLKRLAGNRGLDIIKNASGLTIYLIGKFLTFESAAEYADLLSRNGYKEARVTAYLGMREIPVETARQLFEKY